MIDQLIIGDKSSYDDYGASLNSRKISPPKKKSIKETVPFSNVTYDFTKINGEIYWEERDLEYTLEMIAETPEKLEEMKTALEGWLLNIIQENLHDPYIPDYHFVATYNDLSYTDDEGLNKTTVTVKFTAYPYKIANYPTEYKTVVKKGTTGSVWVLNSSSHKVTPTFICDSDTVTSHIGNTVFNISNGEQTFNEINLETGHNHITFDGGYLSEDANITIRFYEEVF